MTEFNDRREPRVQRRVRASQIRVGDHLMNSTYPDGYAPIIHVGHTILENRKGVDVAHTRIVFANGSGIVVPNTSAHTIAHLPAE